MFDLIPGSVWAGLLGLLGAVAAWFISGKKGEARGKQIERVEQQQRTLERVQTRNEIVREVDAEPGSAVDRMQQWRKPGSQ